MAAIVYFGCGLSRYMAKANWQGNGKKSIFK